MKKSLCRSIIKQLEAELGSFSNCAAVVISPLNRFYLTDFSSSAGFLVLTKEKNYLLLDARYYSAATNVVEAETVKVYSYLEEVSSLLEQLHIGTVFVDTEYISLAEAKKLESVLSEKNIALNTSSALDYALTQMRMCKRPDELKKIIEAQRITQSCFDHILGFIEPGITELSISTELEFFAKKLGAKSVAFDFIVASGENSAIPHSMVSNKKIEKKDIILLDIGVNFNGYMSDMSRTVFLGKPSIKQREVYKIVSEAQNLAISEIKPGVRCAYIDKVAREFIDNTTYCGKFLHSTGHGVGIEIHEKPYISKKSNEVLRPGMVVTVEPGIYILGEFGIRIEDMVLVTDNGYENLTKASKEIISL